MAGQNGKTHTRRTVRPHKAHRCVTSVTEKVTENDSAVKNVLGLKTETLQKLIYIGFSDFAFLASG